MPGILFIYVIIIADNKVIIKINSVAILNDNLSNFFY